MSQTYAERAARELRSDLNESIFSMDSVAFSAHDSSEYLNDMTANVLLVRDQYFSKIPAMMSYLVQFVSCVIYSLMLNPMVALVLMVMSVIQYFVPMLYGKTINELTVIQSKESGSFTSKMKALLLGRIHSDAPRGH